MTTQLAQVKSSLDRVVSVHAARARAAENVVQAANALRDGKKDEARAFFDKNVRLFKEAEAIAGPAAVAGDLRAQQELDEAFAGAKAPEEVADQVKGAKRKARIDSGRMSSTY